MFRLLRLDLTACPKWLAPTIIMIATLGLLSIAAAVAESLAFRVQRVEKNENGQTVYIFGESGCNQAPQRP